MQGKTYAAIETPPRLPSSISLYAGIMGIVILQQRWFAMDTNQKLPFKVGQIAESMSFQTGFRGAWFRCKIRDIGRKNGYISYSLEYFDFPDEKIRSTKLYQMPPSRQEKKLHLMVRPSYPTIYQKGQLPDPVTITEVIVVVDDVWKVDDLVDWWTDGCYWSGRITHILGDDKVKIKLPDPPLGEGRSYEVSSKELRPSLDWSPERGWTVPISSGTEFFRYCARLVHPVNQETGIIEDPSKEGTTLEDSAASVPSNGSAYSLPPLKTFSFSPKRSSEQLYSSGLNEDKDKQLLVIGLGVGTVKPSYSDSISSTFVEPVSAATDAGMKDQCDYDGPPKKQRFSGHAFLNSSVSDTIESSIMDLEELVNKIKWLKRVHQFGFEHANAMTPSWKFLEDRLAITHT